MTLVTLIATWIEKEKHLKPFQRVLRHQAFRFGLSTIKWVSSSLPDTKEHRVTLNSLSVTLRQKAWDIQDRGVRKQPGQMPSKIKDDGAKTVCTSAAYRMCCTQDEWLWNCRPPYTRREVAERKSEWNINSHPHSRMREDSMFDSVLRRTEICSHDATRYILADDL
jgi:hypothetical protein